MAQKRLFIAIAISIAILLGFQMVVRPHLPQPPVSQAVNTTAPTGAPASAPGASQPVVSGALGADAAARQVAKQVPRVRIAGAKMAGSISLLGARIDDLVLSEYREMLEPDSPLVHLLEPRSEAQPYYVQYGWSNAPGTDARLPDNDT